MKKTISFILAAGMLTASLNAFADSRVSLCTDLGETYINTEKSLNAVVKTDAEWIRFSTEAWRNCLQSDGSFVYPESEKELLKKIGDSGIKRISILGMGTPTNKYFRTQEDKNTGTYAMWYDLPVYIEGDSYAIEYWNANLEAIENTVRAQLGLIDAYEVWNEPNHWGFNGYTKKCNTCGKEYEGYNMPSKCTCGGELTGVAQTTGAEYADIYVAWREIVDRVYEEAGLIPVPVYCGSVTGWTDDDKVFFGDVIDRIAQIDGDLSKVDGITLHLYGKVDEYWGADVFADYKRMLSDSGFYGELFMTETGLYTSGYTDTEQALDMIPRIVFYENFLKNMKSAGLATDGSLLYYELQDGGNDPQEAENNFGLIDFMYDNKEGADTITVLNKVLKGKELVSFSHEDAEEIINTSADAKEIRVAQYEGNGDTAYLIFRHEDRSSWDFNTTVTLDVSGDEVRTYNYTGGLKEVIDTNPAETKRFTGIKANNPTIVECVTYKSKIEWAKYDEESGIISFEGNFWNEESFDKTTCTAEVINQNGEIVASTTVNVENDRFSDWISLAVPDGEYTLRIGANELSDRADEISFTIANPDVEKVTPVITGVTAVYDNATETIKLSGGVENPVKNQKITVMALPSDVDLNDVKIDSIGYIKEIELTRDNTFSDEIKLPEWYNGASKLYISGSSVEEVKNSDFVKEESEFAYVAGFSGAEDVTVSAKAVLRNFTSKEQKAVILLSEYSAKGYLIKTHIQPVTIPAKTYSMTAFELKDIVPDKDTAKIKAFLWSDTGTLKPLAQAVNIRN